jgi:hypothetical protein
MTMYESLPAHPVTDTRVVRRLDDVRAHLVMTLLVVGVVSWRRKTYFSGGFDPVVVAKAALIALALVIALSIPGRARLERLPVSSLVLLVVYSVVTALGGWVSGSLFSAAVLSIRLLITAAVLIVMSTKFSGVRLFELLRNAMLVVALVSVATGSAVKGRLTGGIPPLSPNELALLGGVSVLSLAWAALQGRGRPSHGVLFLALMVIVYLTGSRTGLAFLVIALVVMLVQSRYIPIAAALGGLTLIPTAAWVIGSTGFVQAFADRGGQGNITTLSSRTIAWSAALQRGGPLYQQLFGGGLALKQIPVAGQYWNQQTLDSTWISALVQGGYVGVLLLLLWVGAAISAVARSVPQERMLWTGLVVFVVGRSVLESGMLDSSAAFLLFFVVCLGARASRAEKPGEVRPGE